MGVAKGRSTGAFYLGVRFSDVTGEFQAAAQMHQQGRLIRLQQ